MDDVDRPARRCLVGGRRGDDLADDLFPMASVGCCPQCGYGRPWSSLLTQKVASRRARGLVCMTLKSRGWTGGSIVSGFPLGASFAVSRRVCRNAAGVFVPRGVSTPVHPLDRRDHVRTKITVQVARSAIRRTRRPQAPALLTVILVGSRLECREDGRSHAGTLGRSDGGPPVTGGAWGNAQAAARRAPEVLRRSCQLVAMSVQWALAPAPTSAPSGTLPASARPRTG